MLETIDHGPVRELRLARPPANALNAPLLNALNEALQRAPEEADAVVVSGAPGMFSAGLDVPELLEFDRPAFTSMWSLFIDVHRTIAMMPIPTVFALTGHAPAGAILLAVFGDYRIMPEGSCKTGLNEVRIGLFVPDPPFSALARLTGSRAAEKLVVTGEMIAADEAAEIGLVDELVPTPSDVVPRAIEWCRQHLEFPPKALKATRDLARADLQALFDADYEPSGELFIDLWFSDSTQDKLQRLVAGLKKS